MTKAGIIGCGGMGNMHAQACIVSGLAELVAVADEDKSRAEIMAAKLGCGALAVDELLQHPGIETVMICTPTPTHKNLALKAIEAGKNVFLEKPLARNLQEANEIVQAASAHGVFAQVGHVLRFWPEYTYLKQTAESGCLGKLVSLKMSRVSARPGWAANNWYLDSSQSGGAALDLHLHDTDFIHYLLGKPAKVYASGVKDGYGWRQIASQYIYDKGPLVFADGAWYNAEKYEFRMSYAAEFEEGLLDFDSARETGLLFFPKNGEKETVSLPPVPETKPVEGINVTNLGGYLLQDSYFLECINQGKSAGIAPFSAGRDAIAIVEAEIQSAERGEPVQL